MLFDVCTVLMLWLAGLQDALARGKDLNNSGSKSPDKVSAPSPTVK
jgi:hypothetical protein